MFWTKYLCSYKLKHDLKFTLYSVHAARDDKHSKSLTAKHNTKAKAVFKYVWFIEIPLPIGDIHIFRCCA